MSAGLGNTLPCCPHCGAVIYSTGHICGYWEPNYAGGMPQIADKLSFENWVRRIIREELEKAGKEKT